MSSNIPFEIVKSFCNSAVCFNLTSSSLSLTSLKNASRSGCLIIIFIFCFGVRSACLATTLTHSNVSLMSSFFWLVKEFTIDEAMEVSVFVRLDGLFKTSCAKSTVPPIRDLPDLICSIALRHTNRKVCAVSSQYFFESFTKLQPLTSHTTLPLFERNRSKPQMFCLKAKTTVRAMLFSASVRITGYRSSFPRSLRFTLPSIAGALRASACA
mmetsp:Transcript_68515/g.108745  ORF Transcript_68515/g.108745 Transcript_68515/m.108745 type:complete len:212 (+) Transcript_68515:101-736(+)